MSTSCCTWQPGMHSQYSNSLQAGCSETQTLIAAIFSTPIQTGLEAHPSHLYNG